MQRLEQKLAKSVASSSMMPSLALWRESLQDWKQKEALAAELERAAAEAQREAEQASASDDAAQQALAAGEPKLLQRKEQLEQAVLLQKERDEIKSLYERLHRQRKEAQDGMLELRQLLAKEQELLKRGEQKQAELQEKLGELEVTSKERSLLHKALELRQLLRSAEDLLMKARRECGEQQTKAASANEQRRQAERELVMLQERERQLSAGMSSLLSQAEQASRRDGAIAARCGTCRASAPGGAEASPAPKPVGRARGGIA